ncbi:glycosyltransferase [Streptomyces sp. NPDC017993]|uniref:glycosyltransferase n=1 Tax=Streptomyces sp. NPDC017993 TaxID=3365027 RepID=UPI0037B08376
MSTRRDIAAAPWTPSLGATGLRIVRIANFIAPASGGLRTALRELGAGYRAAGHEPVLIVPGPPPTGRGGAGAAGEPRGLSGLGIRSEHTAQGRVITVPAPVLPGTGGYRVLTDRRSLQRLLRALQPDRLEVSDRTTLRWTGEWARRARVPSVMVSHESVDGVLGTWGVPRFLARSTADRLNSRTAHAYSRVVCTTEWAAAEFTRVGARNVVLAPLGVDLAAWHPGCRSTALRQHCAGRAAVLLVLSSRLSPEKRPGRALDTLAELRRRGVEAALVVAGDGPLRDRLEARVRAERLPAAFLGHLTDRARLAALQASADVALAPGPAETFGLAALEALACGTPVIASASSALAGLVGGGGDTALDDSSSFADAVQRVMARPEPARRAAARQRAEGYGWQPAVDAFLAAHDAPVDRRGVETGPAALPYPSGW